MLLTAAEDRATLRSDLSADRGDFKAESDAVRVALFFVCKTPLSAENHNALNLGFGQSPMSRRLLRRIFLNSLPLAHGLFAVNHNGIRVMNDPVADGVRQNRLADLIPPAWYVKLRTEDR